MGTIRRPSRADVAAARAILAAEESAVAEERGALVDPCNSRLLYRADQVSYSLHSYGIPVTPGLKLGYCEWANRQFGETIPVGQPRFIRGTVARVDGDFMTIDFDQPPKDYAALNVSCGIAATRPFCIPLPKARRPHTGGTANAE